MRFSALKPTLGSYQTLCRPGAPVWMLEFACPACGIRTSIAISDRAPTHPIWQIRPGPLVMMDSIKTGDVIAQWDAIWDGVTIEPSLQQLPHPRQVSCNTHFSVINGEITLH